MTTKQWHKSWQVGRLQIKFTVYRHSYATSADRWVFQSNFVYDRKR